MRPPKARFVVLLLAATTVGLILPSCWTDWIRGLFQTVGLVEGPLTVVSRDATDRVQTMLAPGSRGAVQSLQSENEALQRTILHQQLQLETLEEQLRRAEGLRDALPSSGVVLVRAPVLSFDADPRRQTLRVRLYPQTRHLVKQNQWVVAGRSADPTRSEAQRSWLIGRVAEVQTRLARVVLASDPSFAQEVAFAKPTATGEYEFTRERGKLAGHGGGKMIIEQAKMDYLAAGWTTVVVPELPGLPYPMTIGRVVASQRHDASALHYNLTVEPWGPAEDLSDVFIISFEGSD